MVPTFVGFSDATMVGDLLVWRLPVDDPSPYPGATRHGEGLDEQGRPIRLWWAYATHSGPISPPLPEVWRGYVVNDGEGTEAEWAG